MIDYNYVVSWNERDGWQRNSSLEEYLSFKDLLYESDDPDDPLISSKEVYDQDNVNSNNLAAILVNANTTAAVQEIQNYQ